MSSIATTTCDKCGIVTTDPKWKYTVIGGVPFDLCDSCLIVVQMEAKTRYTEDEAGRLMTLENDLRQMEASWLNAEAREKELRDSHRQLAADTVKLANECETHKRDYAAVQGQVKARNDAWLREHEEVLTLQSALSDTRDEVEFLEKNVAELIGMLGKKRRKKNAACIEEMALAYEIVLKVPAEKAQTVKEFIDKGRAAGQDAFGIATDGGYRYRRDVVRGKLPS